MIAETKLAIAYGVAAMSVAWTVMEQDLTPVEKHAVLWLLSAVVLLIGGGGLKLLYDLNKSITANTVAVNQLAGSIGSLVTQNQEAHRTYASERDRAVDEVTGAIRDVRDQLLKEIERNNGKGRKE